MKFPRNARIFRGQLDAAPFVAVLFILALFLMISSLVYTPGIHVQLPVADGFPGTDKPTVAVAVDRNGRLYYENQGIEETDLKLRLRKAVSESPKPLVLVVEADEAVPYSQIVRLPLLARDAGIGEALLATLPRPLAQGSRNGSL